MGYNLVLDTSFKNNENNWRFINCEYRDGYLISHSKIFGIEERLILPDPTKLYFRYTYNIKNEPIKEIKIGIQNRDVLNINRKFPRKNRFQNISLVDNAKQEEIKIHLIFESEQEENKVLIKEPLLVDLEKINKTSWLKWSLDKVLFFDNGYSYKNIYKESEITPTNEDFKFILNLEKAKIGSLAEIKSNSIIPLNNNLEIGKNYLFKLDYKEVNEFGDIDVRYGSLHCIKLGNEQLYLIFKANSKDRIEINLKSTDIINYKINLKHILLIETTAMGLKQEDIGYIPFI